MKHSDDTKRKISERRAAQGKLQTQQVQLKVAETLSLMRAEILANNGVYPREGVRLGKAEIARRADLSESVLHLASYAQTLQEIKEWLKNPSGALQDKLELPPAVASKRRTLKQLNEFYKAQNEKLQNAQVFCRLEAQQAYAERDEALAKVDELRDEVERLNVLVRTMSGEKVVRMKSRQ